MIQVIIDGIKINVSNLTINTTPAAIKQAPNTTGSR
jgi:hypothetical protein